MSLPSRSVFLLAAALALTGPALADTITLKSGAKIEGKILSETATEVTIEYHETATILDRKTLKRAEIATITKETPDIAAWAALKAARPVANSLPTEQYEKLLFPLRGFVSAYPASQFLEEAKKNLGALEEEKKRVDGGEVKIADRWLSREEAEKERYQISGLVAFNFMKAQAAGGDLMGALNSFAQIEKNFGGAASFPDAVELAARVLPTVKATVERAHQNLKNEAIGRQTAATSAKAELEAAAKREEDAGAASVVAAERAGLKWPPLNIRSSKSLAKIAEKMAQETPRVTGLPVAAMRQSIVAAEAAKAAVASGDLEAAEAALKNATVWEPNELAKRLTAELAEMKKAGMESEKVAKAPVPAAPPATAAVATPPSKSQPQVSEVPAGAAPVEEKPFYLTPVGIAAIVGGVAALLIGLRVLASKRRRAEDE